MRWYQQCLIYFIWVTFCCWRIPNVLSQRYENCKVVVHVGQKNLKQCFPVQAGVSWYGAGGSSFDDTWPLKMDRERPERPELPGGWDGKTNRVLNRFWINSEGISIKVNDDVPLFTSIERDTHLGGFSFCLMSEYKFPYLHDSHETVKLAYTMCRGTDLKDIFLNTVSESFQKPNGKPLEVMFKSPIWQSMPLNTPRIMTEVYDFIMQIEGILGITNPKDKGLVLLGPEWQGCSGDFRFSSAILPHPQEFLAFLKETGFRVGLTVTPFFGQECLMSAKPKNIYFIRDENNEPMFIERNGKNHTLVDFTVDEAATWWKKRLMGVKEELPDIDAFLFDEGLASYLPEGHVELNGSAETQPGVYVSRYLQVAASFQNDMMVGSGYLSQQYPLFVNMPQVSPDWDSLKTIVPRTLQMGVLGFPFIVPPAPPTSMDPSSKLFLRWMQVNALMPAFHVPLVNWQNTGNAPYIVKGLFELRDRYLPVLMDSSDQFLVSGSPIIRPLWWLAPTDINTHGYADQFVLGTDTIVAPIVDESDARDIYLPEGKWFDQLRKVTRSSGKLEQYHADLNELPIFTREE